jgi:hypothetical protein
VSGVGMPRAGEAFPSPLPLAGASPPATLAIFARSLPLRSPKRPPPVAGYPCLAPQAASGETPSEAAEPGFRKVLPRHGGVSPTPGGAPELRRAG